MLTENKRVADVLGISAWHDFGYTGKYGVSASFEPIDCGHGLQPASVFKEFAPDRKLLSMSGFSDYAKFITDNHVDTVFSALIDEHGIYSEQLVMPDDVLKFCTLFQSTGNTVEHESWSANLKLPYYFGVGAVSSSDFCSLYYSWPSPYISFASCSGIYIKFPNGIINPIDGTTQSVGLLCAMAALVNSVCIEKSKQHRPMSNNEMKRFLIAHCNAVPSDGWSEKVGYGVPVLPDPSTFNPDEWMADMEIKMTLGSDTYTIDGIAHTMDVAPFAQDNRTFVPIRFIAEALGCTVDWDDTTQTVTIKR